MHESVTPGFPFPTMAPLGISSPPTSGTMGHSDFCPPISASSGCPLSADTSWFPCFLYEGWSQRNFTTPHQELLVTRLSFACLTGTVHRGGDRSPRFLNQPCVRLPRSTTPAGLMIPPSLSNAKYCLPSRMTTSASHDYTTFQGSITQPAYLLLPCFTCRLTTSRAEFATGLLTGFSRVGIAPTG